MLDTIRNRFRQLRADVEFCSLRYVEDVSEHLQIRQNVEQPLAHSADKGVMLTVIDRGGYGYAATSDYSSAGLEAALAKAKDWAASTRTYSVFDYSDVSLPAQAGCYAGAGMEQPMPSRRELLELLMASSRRCGIDERIVDWQVGLQLQERRQLYLTRSGADIEQHFRYLVPELAVTAYADGDSQTRSFGGFAGQGGYEALRQTGFFDAGSRVAEEALALLSAPNCPTGEMDLLLMPEQMILQIHESIGHPLELDRILGDERNYAGTSFVTRNMFGSYRYGSDRLNVTYDPTIKEEYASFGWDDDGSPSEKTYLIHNGILLRPLGGAVSQNRAGMAGSASSRACSWNRPAIDRMANLNIEPGQSTLEEMIGTMERGVIMDTNRSWSIDDSRNKFQFGCEQGWLVEQGKIKHLVKNPGYRGVSANFWRSLDLVGDSSTSRVLGTPYCGKGEPNQVIQVGHASPACLFRKVDIFGGHSE